MALLRKLTANQRKTIGNWIIELAVVIAGVLIALWLQQWADRRRALADMETAEAAIHEEVRETLTGLIWREAISKCQFERAELLKSMLTENQSRWPGFHKLTLTRISFRDAVGIPTVVPSVYQRPRGKFTMSAWNSALATGALAPMEKRRFALLAGTYDFIQTLAENEKREDRAVATLSALAFPQTMTPDTRTRMFEALYEIDLSLFNFNAGTLSGLADAMIQLGWNDRAEIDRWIREDLAADIKQSQYLPCVAPARNPFASS